MLKLSGYSVANPRLHVCIWIVFITFEIVSIGMEYGQFGHPLAYIQNYALHILFFYVHALAVMPCWNRKSLNNYSRFVVLVISEYVIYICFNYQLNYGLLSFSHPMNEVKLEFGYRFILGRTWRLTYFLGMSTAYYFLVTYLKAQQENLTLERQAMEYALREKDAEMALNRAINAALKSQINPHFFSNVLNFMYSRSRKSDPQVGEAILLLSKMMRYAIKSEQASGKVSVGTEIAEVINLISLWQLVKADRFFVEVSMDPEADAVELIPLVLLTLAENIFKHADLSDPKEPALISIQIDGERLSIRTRNLAFIQDSNQTERATGLENIRQRLLFEYGDDILFRYELDEANRFHVLVEIELFKLN